MYAYNSLISLIRQAAQAKGHDAQQVMQILGLTAEQYDALTVDGIVPSGASRTTLVSLAAYCRVPVIIIFLALGKLRLEDFVIPDATVEGEVKKPFSSALNVALVKMLSDPLVTGFFPKELWECPDNVKGFVVLLYQELTQQEIIESQQYPKWMRQLHTASLGECGLTQPSKPQ